eukprot:1901630-Pyramimonas_sp.AAC.1
MLSAPTESSPPLECPTRMTGRLVASYSVSTSARMRTALSRVRLSPRAPDSNATAWRDRGLRAVIRPSSNICWERGTQAALR